MIWGYPRDFDDLGNTRDNMVGLCWIIGTLKDVDQIQIHPEEQGRFLKNLHGTMDDWFEDGPQELYLRFFWVAIVTLINPSPRFIGIVWKMMANA